MSIAGQYDFLDQSRIVFGEDARAAVENEARQRDAKRVLIVSSRTLNRKLSAAGDILSSLASRSVGVYDDIEPHAPLNAVQRLLERIKADEPDLVVCLGGGSVIDTVKVALLAYTAGVSNLDDILKLRMTIGRDGKPKSPSMPDLQIRQIAVPTTLSGAEFGTIGGAVDPARNVKDVYSHPQLCADVVIYDPALAKSTPNDLWTSTGMRAVDHAVETILSIGATPYTDGAALHALRLLGRSLVRGHQSDMSTATIEECQFGVWLSTVGLGRIPYGASHGIGHQLGAISGVPHGLCTCVLLPAVLRYNAAHSGERDAMISGALGCNGMSAADAVLSLVRRLGLADGLKRAGVSMDDFDAIASASVGSFFVVNNLRPITGTDQIIEILNLAWDPA